MSLAVAENESSRPSGREAVTVQAGEILGLVGEYLGRLYLDQTGTPQFVVRYTMQGGATEPGQ